MAPVRRSSCTCLLCTPLPLPIVLLSLLLATSIVTNHLLVCTRHSTRQRILLASFRLHASGNVKSKVCMAATFQLMKRGSISSLHFRTFSSASRAAPMQGATAGDVIPNNILLIGGYRGHWSGSDLDPESHSC